MQSKIVVAAFVFLLPAAANAADPSHCAEILRQGMYDYYFEKDRDISESDVRSAILNASGQNGSSASGGGLNVAFKGFSLGGNYSQNELNASYKLLRDDNSEIVKNDRALLKDIRTISPAALKAYNQCLRLSAVGVQVTVENPDRLVSTITVQHANAGSTSKLQRLQMAPAGAFACRGSLAQMAQSGGVITTSALNMTCERKHDKDAKGVPVAPSATIVVDTDQGSFSQHYPALVRPVVDNGPSIVPSGAVLAFDLQACPKNWSEFSLATGRVVVGVGTADGLTERTLRQVGGEETHVLTMEEMPAHDHGPIYGGKGAMAGMLNDPAYHAAGAAPTEKQGGGKAHNLMPPFVALRYCRKD